jgi:hypothetical protein
MAHDANGICLGKTEHSICCSVIGALSSARSRRAVDFLLNMEKQLLNHYAGFVSIRTSAGGLLERLGPITGGTFYLRGTASYQGLGVRVSPLSRGYQAQRHI